MGRRLGQGQPCLLFPSSSAAAAAAQYVRRSSGEPATLREKENLFAVATTPAGDPALRAFWQHSGLILSSRFAEAVLAGRRPLSAGEDHDIRAALRQQLAALYDCAEDDVFLAPSGMAAQYAALRAVLERTPGQATAQLGFPYVDTLKLQQKLGHEGILLHRLAVVESESEELLRRRPLAACFSEIPANPLLGSADLRRVSPLLRRHRVPLVADDVVASPLNVDLGPDADLVADKSDEVLRRHRRRYGRGVDLQPESPLVRGAQGPRGGPARGVALGRGGAGARGPGPAIPAADAPAQRDRALAGGTPAAASRRGPGVVSQVGVQRGLRRGPPAGRRLGGSGELPPGRPSRVPLNIYDRMAVCKGPSLGTVFTLACPFTLLAHYTELGWAERCGLPAT